MMRMHPAMSRRVSTHFKERIDIAYDDKEREYAVLNRGNPIYFFKAFNSTVVHWIKQHLELKHHKHNMPKQNPGQSRQEYYDSMKHMFDEAARETAHGVRRMGHKLFWYS